MGKNEELAGMHPVSGMHTPVALYSFSGLFHGTSREYEMSWGCVPELSLVVQAAADGEKDDK